MTESEGAASVSDLEKYYEHLYTPDYEQPSTTKNALTKAIKDRTDPQLHWIASTISSYGFKVVHDYGCGIGRFIAVAHDVGMFNDRQFCYIGIDIERRLLKFASGLADKLSVSDQTIFVTVNEWRQHSTLKKPSSCIITNDVLHHLHHSILADLFFIFIHSMNSALIVAETALLKRAEGHRIPLSNEDLQFLSQRLRLPCRSFNAIGPGKGLPLTRVVIEKPANWDKSFTVQYIDDVLRDTLLQKLANERSRLNASVLDKRILSRQPYYLTRVGVLEICESTEYVLSHWSDHGFFSTLLITLPVVYIGRPIITKRMRVFIAQHLVCFIYGDFGVGKSTLLKWMLANENIDSYAAVASDTGDIAELVSWVLIEARQKRHKAIESNCMEYVRSRGSLETILRSLSQNGYALVIDNAHLCRKTCIDSLVHSARSANCRLICVFSIDPSQLKLTVRPPVFQLRGFTQRQTSELLRRLQNRKFTQKETRHAWQTSRKGNPQLLLMRFIGIQTQGISGALGTLNTTEWDILSWALATPGGIRGTELVQLGRFQKERIHQLVIRRILEKSGRFLRVHDVVAANAMGVEGFPERLEKARRILARELERALLLQKHEKERLSEEKTKDALRLIALLRNVGDYSKAWNSLNYCSYSVYMDGTYDVLLGEIERNKAASPKDYVPELDSSLFWLFIRQGRIFKRRYQLEDALHVFEELQRVATGREYLAILKELGEITRVKGNHDRSEQLLKEAMSLDRKWARDERDILITKKQLALTLIEKDDFNVAEKLLHENLRQRKSDDLLGIASCKGALGGLAIRRLKKEGFAEGIVTESWIMLSDALSLFERCKDLEGLSGILRKMSELAEFLAEVGKDRLLVERIARCTNDRLSICLDPPKSETERRLENVVKFIDGI